MKTRRTLLAAMAMVLILAGFCGASAMLLLELRKDTRVAVASSAQSLLATLSADIAQNIATYDATLKLVVRDLHDSELWHLEPYLRRRVIFAGAATAEGLERLFIVDSSGNVVEEEGAVVTPEASLSDQPFFQVQKKADAGLFIGTPFVDPATGKSLIALSRRIAEPSGRFAGVVVAYLRLDFFQEIFERTSLDSDDTIGLLSQDGYVLMRFPSIGSTGRNVSSSATMARLREGASGTFSGVSPIDGKERFYTYMHLRDTPLILTLAISKARVFAAWENKAIMIAVLLGTLCVMTALLGLMLGRAMGRHREAEAALRTSEAEYRLLADNATDVIMRLDRDLTRRYASPALRDLLGYEPEELVGKTIRPIIHPDDWSQVENLVATAQAELANAEATYRIRHKDGHYIWVEGRYSFVSADGGFIVVLRNISRRKAAEEKLAAAHAELEHLATTDGLTGLANRRSFDNALAREVARAQRDKAPLSLLLLDVDRFKIFNDRYGHPAGDACLRQVASVVGGGVLRPGDLAARYGGEELAVILPGTDEAGARIVADRIRAGIEALCIEHEGNDSCGSVVTVSIGVAQNRDAEPQAADAPQVLIADADRLLYEAKRLGRNRIVSGADLSSEIALCPEEEARLVAVQHYREALSPQAAGELDRISELAANLLGTPKAFVSLMDSENVMLVGRYNMEVDRVPRRISFCGHTLAGSDPLVVLDTHNDPRFADNPLRKGAGGISFYAGAPLVDPTSGQPIGAFCIVDTAPHPSFGHVQRETLKNFATMAMQTMAPAVSARSPDARTAGSTDAAKTRETAAA